MGQPEEAAPRAGKTMLLVPTWLAHYLSQPRAKGHCKPESAPSEGHSSVDGMLEDREKGDITSPAWFPDSWALIHQRPSLPVDTHPLFY